LFAVVMLKPRVLIAHVSLSARATAMPSASRSASARFDEPARRMSSPRTTETA
jgi:hypothetical protein